MNKDTSFAVATAPRRNSKHWKQTTVTWGELITWAQNPGSTKESGNYMMGELRRTKACQRCADAGKTQCRTRSSAAVMSRSMITLDVDTPPDDFLDIVDLVWDSAMLLHTTYSSSPAQRKYRLLIPTDRPMSPDEYVVAARAAMQLLGGEGFDPSTDQPARYMFRPAASDLAEYAYLVLPGEAVSVEDLLGSFDPNLSALPMPKPSRFKRNPFEIEGVVGSFNRAYRDWDTLIEAYDLPYEPAGERRWALISAAGAAGMGEVTEGLVYSHHVSDPAYDQTCSAFDLVRLHLYSELDLTAKPNTPVAKLPSHFEMLRTAQQDPRVLAEIAGLDFSDLGSDPDADLSDAWRLKLTDRNPRTNELRNTARMRQLLLENDPLLKTVGRGEFSLGLEFASAPPWSAPDRSDLVVSKADVLEFRDYLEHEYQLRLPKTDAEDLMIVAGERLPLNPVRDYLDSLVWDGVPRVETALPGVTPTPYTRLVARKCLVAAVARIYDPGCKWDHTLILSGDEGLGKTYWVEKMARGYHSHLGNLDSKDTILSLQRSWIMTSDESHSLRKADSEKMKEFLTRSSDIFRMPYDRETRLYKRHSVIWGTTNDREFLRNEQGNRRFLIVRCERQLDFDAVTDDYVDQVWAEAVHLYRAGEKLYLTPDEAALAGEEREAHVEEDTLVGIIQQYLDTPVPLHWETMSRHERHWHAQHPEPGEVLMERVCSRQIWEEALGQYDRVLPTATIRQINEAIRQIPGWSTESRSVHSKAYGRQRFYNRLHSSEESDWDLI